MKIVIYDGKTGEPITVTNIIDWHRLDIPVGQSIVIPILSPVSICYEPEAPVPEVVFNSITIHFTEVWFDFGRVKSWFAYTSDAESALRLHATFLPGQSAELNRRREDAIGQGIVRAFELMGMYRRD